MQRMYFFFLNAVRNRNSCVLNKIFGLSFCVRKFIYIFLHPQNSDFFLHPPHSDFFLHPQHSTFFSSSTFNFFSSSCQELSNDNSILESKNESEDEDMIASRSIYNQLSANILCISFVLNFCLITIKRTWKQYGQRIRKMLRMLSVVKRKAGKIADIRDNILYRK